MSAINPASFASPTLGIQAPSGIGPGAVGVGRTSSSGERRQSQQAQEQQPQAFGQQPQLTRGFRPSANQPFGGERQVSPASGYPSSNYAYGTGGAFGTARGNASYVPSFSPGLEGFPNAAYPQPGDFHSMRQRYPNSQTVASPAPHSQGISPISPQNDWSAAFQGLSLNTH